VVRYVVAWTGVLGLNLKFNSAGFFSTTIYFNFTTHLIIFNALKCLMKTKLETPPQLGTHGSQQLAPTQMASWQGCTS
jgi:hypothetical protein